MVDPKQKSKAQSSGNWGKRRPRLLLKNPTFYLDESLDCREVKQVLDDASIKYKVYSQHFSRSEDDEAILKLAGQRGWLMLTGDSKNRFRDAERRAVLFYKVRLFIFSGNMGGIPLARLVISLKNKIFQFCREHEPPFIATITTGGKILLRMDKRGNVHQN